MTLAITVADPYAVVIWRHKAILF